VKRAKKEATTRLYSPDEPPLSPKESPFGGTRWKARNSPTINLGIDSRLGKSEGRRPLRHRLPPSEPCPLRAMRDGSPATLGEIIAKNLEDKEQARRGGELAPVIKKTISEHRPMKRIGLDPPRGENTSGGPKTRPLSSGILETTAGLRILGERDAEEEQGEAGEGLTLSSCTPDNTARGRGQAWSSWFIGENPSSERYLGREGKLRGDGDGKETKTPAGRFRRTKPPTGSRIFTNAFPVEPKRTQNDRRASRTRIATIPQLN